MIPVCLDSCAMDTFFSTRVRFRLKRSQATFFGDPFFSRHMASASHLPEGWTAVQKECVEYQWRCPIGTCTKGGKLLYKKKTKKDCITQGAYHLLEEDKHGEAQGFTMDNWHDVLVKSEEGCTEYTGHYEVWVDPEGEEHTPRDQDEEEPTEETRKQGGGNGGGHGGWKRHGGGKGGWKHGGGHAGGHGGGHGGNRGGNRGDRGDRDDRDDRDDRGRKETAIAVKKRSRSRHRRGRDGGGSTSSQVALASRADRQSVLRPGEVILDAMELDDTIQAVGRCTMACESSSCARTLRATLRMRKIRSWPLSTCSNASRGRRKLNTPLTQN